MSAIVRMAGITHDFGDLRALDSVDFEVEQGSIHALVGENGAGKTTLMRALYGALQPTAGLIEVRGAEVRWRSSADAIAHRIGMVSQHYSIIPELTCLQNLILGAEGAYVIPESRAVQRANELAKKMGFEFDWLSAARGLSPAAAQKLEILKLLWRESEIMVLDEPTAMLSPADSDALFDSLKQLSKDGATIIVVTHRLPEVMQHCEHVTVLRGGKKVAAKPVADTSPHELAEMIVGHSVSVHEVAPFDPGEPVLELSGIVVKGARGDDALKGADLTVRRGEVVGLAGVDGNGQRELFHSLVGLSPFAAGTASFCGEDMGPLQTSERILGGLRLIPEDRHEEGVIERWSLTENAALGLQRIAPLANGRFVVLSAKAELAERVAARFKTKHSGLGKPISNLSGGNQQRFVAARALELDPKLILAFQPTRGLDIDGTAQVYGEIRRACREGAAALVVSFDLDELLENCDRVLAINHGKIYAPAPGSEHDRQAIGRLMVGVR